MALVSLTNLVRGGVVVYIFIGSILLHDHILREIAGGLVILVGIAYGLFSFQQFCSCSSVTTSRDLVANAIWGDQVCLEYVSSIEPPENMRDAQYDGEQV